MTSDELIKAMLRLSLLLALLFRIKRRNGGGKQ